MDLRQLHHFARHSLKGRYAAALRASWLRTGMELVGRLVPAGFAGLLVVRSTMTAQEVWSGGWLWAAFCVLWALFCAGVLLPVRCGVCNWYGVSLGLTRRRVCFPSVSAYLHTAAVSAAAGLLTAAAAFFPAAAGMLCVTAFRESAVRQDSGMWLFAAVQAFLAMLWAGVYCIRLRVNLYAVPFLCTEIPQAGALTIIRRSFRLMEGHHRTFWAIVLRYLPAMLTLVPMTWLLPYLDCELMLFLQLRLRETAACESSIKEESACRI